MSSRFCAVSTEPTDLPAGSDLILPCQYYDLSGGHHLTGEQRLMLALLTDAINVYQKGALAGSTRARRLYVDAARWIMSDREPGNSLTFSTVCEALGINEVLLRRRIIAWKHAISRRQRDSHAGPRLHFQVTSRFQRRGRSHGRMPQIADAV
jgi:hypothetical protein